MKPKAVMISRVPLMIFVAAGACCACAAFFSLGRRPGEASTPAPLAAKAVADDGYIGLQACAPCHAAQYQSYLKTAHSQALADVEPPSEPDDGQFEHVLSGRSYRVYREGGQLRHREWLMGAERDLQADYPAALRIGSGRHTRSYLMEDDGFFMESPITWYASRQAWGLSPGYDHPGHLGFERGADLTCITCHVGRAEPREGSLSRVVIHEQAIGCERCHGPGARHARRKRSLPERAEAGEEAIVNPATLPRDLQEAVCAQCHLRSDATVFLAGCGANDLRPGKALTDFRIDYQYERPSDRMTVVGHVEQMRASRCRQMSETLTCTTCHDPHAPPDESRKAEHYRAKCLACHVEAACGLPLKKRQEQVPGDRCAACHMPQSPTDIPHIAFTHHRIGVHHDLRIEAPSDRLADLAPMDDLSHLSESDRQRGLGLAYLEAAQTHQDARAHRFYRERALRLLEGVHESGHADAAVDAALARLWWRVAPQKSADYAMAALNREGGAVGARVNALFVLADASFQAHDWNAAHQALDQLVALRRHSEDWRLRGLCQAESGDLASGAASLKRALQINPFRGEIHAELGRVLVAAGQAESAERHQDLARRLKNIPRSAQADSSKDE